MRDGPERSPAPVLLSSDLFDDRSNEILPTDLPAQFARQVDHVDKPEVPKLRA